MKPSGYGPERYHFDGQSLPSLMRQVVASPLAPFDAPDPWWVRVVRWVQRWA